ncbi:MAG: RNA methyltransferase [Chloroflexota bacterium]
MQPITSRQNPKIKLARALREHKERQRSGLFVVEGIRHVGEAVQAGAGVEFILYAPHLLTSEFALHLIEEQTARGLPCYPIPAELFNYLADKEHPPGILAVLRQPSLSLQALSPRNFAWGVTIIAPQDPGNVGAILRTIEAVGADGLILLEDSVDPYHPTAVRASMGALFWKPVVVASFTAFADWAKEHKYHVYASSAHGDKDYHEVKRYPRPCLLLLGSEREGLSPEQRAICEEVIRIPMHGRVTSLNLAVAAGVLLYAMLEPPGGSPTLHTT